MTHWKQPVSDADIPNSLADALASTPPGKLFVYYEGPSGQCPDAVKRAAWHIGARLGALVQRPTHRRTDKGARIWQYMVQRGRI